MALRWTWRRASSLAPPKRQSRRFRAIYAPVYDYVTSGNRQRAVLGRICRKLVNNQRKRLRKGSAHHKRLAADLRARTKGRKLRVDQIPQRHPASRSRCNKLLGMSKRVQPTYEGLMSTREILATRQRACRD